MRKRRRMMSKILISLCVLTVAQLLPAMVTAENYDKYVEFSTAGQSMWAEGGAYNLTYNNFLGYSWDKTGPNSWGFNGITNPDDLGSYGLSVTASTKGTVGVNYGVSIFGGSVNVSYPVKVHLDFPSEINLAKTNTVTINSSYAVNAGGVGMLTLFPALIPHADAVIDLAASLDATGCIVGCVGGNIFNESVNYTKNLLDFLPSFPKKSGDTSTYNLPNNYGQIKVTIPNDLNTTGTLSGNNIVSQTGANTGQFLQTNLNLFKLGEFLPPPLDAAFIAFNSINFGGENWTFYGVGANFNWEIIDLTAGLISRITQSFEFDPDLRVSLLEPDGSTFASFNVGDSVTVPWPDGSGTLDLTPVFSLDNSFTNNTDLSLDPDLSLQLLSGEFKVHIPLPWPFPDINYDKPIGPLFSDTWIANGVDIPVYSNTFELSFDPITGQSFDVKGEIPEPITLILFGSGLLGLAGYGRKKFFKK